MSDCISFWISVCWAISYWCLLQKLFLYFQGIPLTLPHRILCLECILPPPVFKDLVGNIPSSIPDFLYLILVSITEIIFDFHGSHEQFHIRYCVWNFSLLHPARKDFIGIIPSSVPTFLHFILLSIAEIIFYFQGIHEQSHIGYCIWNLSLLHPVRKGFVDIIPSFIPAVLYFILVSITEFFFFHDSHEQNST